MLPSRQPTRLSASHAPWQGETGASDEAIASDEASAAGGFGDTSTVASATGGNGPASTTIDGPASGVEGGGHDVARNDHANVAATRAFTIDLLCERFRRVCARFRRGCLLRSQFGPVRRRALLWASRCLPHRCVRAGSLGDEGDRSDASRSEFSRRTPDVEQVAVRANRLQTRGGNLVVPRFAPVRPPRIGAAQHDET